MLKITQLSDRAAIAAELRAGISLADLRDLTNEMVDYQLTLIAEATDADVVFTPLDPAARDTYAATPEEEGIAWTLGHVIVHTTASAEESAFLAAEQARGILPEGRSRYETPWQSVTTIAECRERLEESRRMRLATLDVWPDTPHLELTYERSWYPEPINAVGRFVLGMGHDASHLGQIEDIVNQAAEVRMAVAG